jgi:hypothetical protein
LRRGGGARGASEASGSPDGAQTESDTARRDRIVASNLASVNTPTFNDGPKNSGGVFQILRIGYDDAEFAFFGWNREIKRRANMRIEVRRTADDVDIRHAIVRKMMAIIREYETEDFTWESVRLGRNIRLSARQRDNADLEELPDAWNFSLEPRRGRSATTVAGTLELMVFPTSRLRAWTPPRRSRTSLRPFRRLPARFRSCCGRK